MQSIKYIHESGLIPWPRRVSLSAVTLFVLIKGSRSLDYTELKR